MLPEFVVSSCRWSCLLLSSPGTLSRGPFWDSSRPLALQGLSWLGVLLSCSWRLLLDRFAFHWGVLSLPLGLLDFSWQPKPTLHGTMQHCCFLFPVWGPPGFLREPPGTSLAAPGWVGAPPAAHTQRFSNFQGTRPVLFKPNPNNQMFKLAPKTVRAGVSQTP